ncbi:MAG: HAMP domain-containing sensor histidine kinase [Candidatus Rokuibacteriota bacterium]
MARNPDNLCRRLSELAMDVCHATSAGVSLLDGELFRWEALVGAHAPHRGRLIPRAVSASAACVDEGLTQVLRPPDRACADLPPEPPVVEAMLVPFRAHRLPVGAVWVVTDRERRRFDEEDERILRVLTDCASAAWEQWKAAEAAMRQNRRRDEILATLLHELRNPLAAITGAMWVVEHTDAPAERAVHHAMEVVRRQGRLLSRIVEDLNDLSRIGWDKLELRPAPIDVATVIADVVTFSLPRIERRGQRLAVDVPSEPLALEADAERLAQVLANLVDNASKYTPDGGDIELSVAARVEVVEFTVRDTGVGIPPDKLHEIFQPFTQLRAPGGRQAEGLGLGLALVDRLVKLHGGHIRVSSEGAGKGAEFTVSLPSKARVRDEPVVIGPLNGRGTGTFS